MITKRPFYVLMESNEIKGVIQFEFNSRDMEITKDGLLNDLLNVVNCCGGDIPHVENTIIMENIVKLI